MVLLLDERPVFWINVRDEREEEDGIVLVDLVYPQDRQDYARRVIGPCVRVDSRSRCRGREVEKGVEQRRQYARTHGSLRVKRLLHGRVVQRLVEDTLRARRVGNVPDNLFPVAHLEPVQVDGRVRVGEGPRGEGVLGADGGEGRGAEDGGADPEGVAVGRGEGCGWGGQGEEVLEDGGAVVPVEGEGEVVGGVEGGWGEVGVVEEGDGEEDVDEECVLWCC